MWAIRIHRNEELRIPRKKDFSLISIRLPESGIAPRYSRTLSGRVPSYVEVRNYLFGHPYEGGFKRLSTLHYYLVRVKKFTLLA
jgi:hypothetical protein